MIHFTDSGGTGVPVLLVHAIGCDHRMWDGLGTALSPRFRVIRMDVRGHGRSAVTPRPYSLDQLADDARDLLDSLKIDKAHWVGLSMGGMIGQAFALRHPDRLNRLVLSNTSSSYGAQGRGMWEARKKLVRESGMAALHDLMVSRNFSEPYRREHPEKIVEAMRPLATTSVEGYVGCCDALAQLEYTASLPRIRARTLVIAGSLDPGTPVAMAEVLASGIPDSQLAVIDGAAHLSAYEKPVEYARLVGRFLDTPES